MFLLLGFFLAGLGFSALWVGSLLDQDLSVVMWIGFGGAVLSWIIRIIRRQASRRRVRREQEQAGVSSGSSSGSSATVSPSSSMPTAAYGSYSSYGSYGSYAEDQHMRRGQNEQYRTGQYGSTGSTGSYNPIQGPPPATKGDDRSLGCVSIAVVGLICMIPFGIGLMSMFVVRGPALSERYGDVDQLIAAALPFLPATQDGRLDLGLEDGPDFLDDSIDLRDADRVQEIVDELISMAGHDEVVEVSFFDNMITGEFAVEPGSDHFDDYEYHVNTGYSHEGPALIQPDLDRETPFNLSVFDAEALGTIWDQLEELTGLDPDAEDAEVDFRLETPRESDNVDLEVWIIAQVRTAYGDERAEFDLEGTFVPEPGGEFDITNPAEVQEILDELVSMAGHDEVAELRIYQYMVTGEFAVEPGSEKFDVYRYHENIGYTHEGPATIQPDLERVVLFRVSDVDPAVIPTIWARLEQDTGYDPDTATNAPSFHLDHWRTPFGEDQQVTITVSLGDEYGNGWAEYSLSGELLGSSD